MTAALTLLRELNNDHQNMAQMAIILDWDGVSSVWETAETRLSLLRKMSLTELQGNDRLEARQLIENVLKLQDLISEQAKPWMDQVRPLLESFDRFPLPSG